MSEVQVDLADRFVAQYHREFDFFDQAARLVAQQLDTKLQATGIRAIVTSRAKQPRRLLEKIKQRSARNPYQDLFQIGEDIVDLAGVRVALYFPGQRREVDNILKDQFALLAEPKKFLGSQDPSYEKRFSGYWAVHYRLRLRESTLTESQQRYSEARVEVQVASVLMHAWAEVEHDLVYKPLQGNLSLDELAILDELNGLVLAGEIALERLQKAMELRVAEGDRSFINHFELAAYLFENAKKISGDDPILGEVDLLFEFLRRLNRANPRSLEPYVQALQAITENRPVAQQIVDQMMIEEPELYDTFSEVKAERESFLTREERESLSHRRVKDYDLGYFLARWIAFERFLQELGKLRGISIGIPTHSKLRLLGLFEEPVLAEIDYIRDLRNKVVHGIGDLDAVYLKRAGARLEEILRELETDPRGDVRSANDGTKLS